MPACGVERSANIDESYRELLAIAPVIANYSAVSQPVHTMSAFHYLRIVGRENERRAGCRFSKCQGRTKTASVGRSKSTSVSWVVLACCRGSARGISPSLLHGVLNVAEQRTEQSYPGSVVG
jgi:hypothetical protein